MQIGRAGNKESAKQKSSGTEWDFASIGGICFAILCILAGLILEGGRIADIGQTTAALVVFGGTLGAVLATTPLDTFLRAMSQSKEVFRTRSQPFRRTLTQLLSCAESSRRSGFASLETFAALQVKDAFFVKALNLVADGTESGQLREMMLLDLDCDQDRSDAEVRVWECAAGYSPTIGILGAIIGLIQVMKHLENLDEVGRGIAVAFVATVYGVAAANLLFLPIAGKLRSRALESERLHQMVLEGILAITGGINPSLLRIKLEPFLDSAPDMKLQQRQRREALPIALASHAARQIR